MRKRTPPAPGYRKRGAPIGGKAIYAVDGMHLGGSVALGSPSYLLSTAAIRATNSRSELGTEAAPGGQRPPGGRIVRPRQRPLGRRHRPLTSTATWSSSGLRWHRGDGRRRRLSTKYGEPHFHRGPPAVAVGPRTLMATWGDVSLQPLDRARLADLSQPAATYRAGILVDHASATSSAPPSPGPAGLSGDRRRRIRMGGELGTRLAAGTLRFLTIDPSRLLPGGGRRPRRRIQPAEPCLQTRPPAGKSLERRARRDCKTPPERSANLATFADAEHSFVPAPVVAGTTG